MRRTISLLALAAGMSACTATGGRNTAAEAIHHEMDAAALESARADKKPEAVDNALLPPLAARMPSVDSEPLEPRFDLAVNNTPVAQVFNAIVSGTRYSMLMPADVTGDISINLKDATVLEALEAIRNMYGYEYKVDGTRIYVQPASLQTRIYQVNYLTGERVGQSSVTVKSSDALSASSGGTSGTTAGTAAGAAGSSDRSSSIITRTSSKDFWTELEESIKAIIGEDKGRTVKLNPMSGVIVVRAMPDELRNVAAYLRASQLSIERQVILEAKIVEVQLNDGFQSGVNWGGFGNLKSSPTSRGSFGVLAPGSTLVPNAAGEVAQSISSSALSATPGTNLTAMATASSNSLFGLAFQTNNFAALLNFLESQGEVHVLSSPRIATLNNQKAVLKVGTDEYFATGFTSTAGTSTGVVVTQTTVTPEYKMFFSGIALDVTPRIDESGDVILHVHPSVSKVGTVNKQAIIGAAGTTGMIPLASSTISETDSIVRAHDGQIVVIGGLMSQETYDDQSGMPGLPKTLFGQTSKQTRKRELVILLKPTVVDADRDWSEDIARSRDRVNGMTR